MDIYYNILLQSDIHMIKTLCIINKAFYQLCHSHYYWINKYNNDKIPLPLLNYTINEWIDLYCVELAFFKDIINIEFNPTKPRYYYFNLLKDLKIADEKFGPYQNKFNEIIVSQHGIKFTADGGYYYNNATIEQSKSFIRQCYNDKAIIKLLII